MQATAPVSVSIVVPVYNEAPILEELHRRLLAVCRDLKGSWELIYVDDGSDDGSGELLDRFSRAEPGVGLIRLARNCGQQAAVLEAFRLCVGDSVVQLDADLQHPPEEIPKLLAALDEGFDLVTTRPEKRRDGFWRAFFSFLIRWLADCLAGSAGQLNLSSFRAMRRHLVKRLLRLSDRRYLAVSMSRMGLRTREIAVRHCPRAQGRSKYSPASLAKLAFILFEHCKSGSTPDFADSECAATCDIREILPPCKSAV